MKDKELRNALKRAGLIDDHSEWWFDFVTPVEYSFIKQVKVDRLELRRVQVELDALIELLGVTESSGRKALTKGKKKVEY